MAVFAPRDPLNLGPLAALLPIQPRLAGDMTGSPPRHSATCLYTRTPADDFIWIGIRNAPRGLLRMLLLAHGFKGRPADRVALADLLSTGQTSLPIDFLSRAAYCKAKAERLGE